MEEVEEKPGVEEEGEEEMEEGQVLTIKSYTGGEEEEVTRLLEQSPEEEEVETVDQEAEEELLRTELVSPKEEGKEKQREEQRGAEITTFLDVTDPTDPLNANQINHPSVSQKTSPKDNKSGNVDTDENDNSKAEATASLVVKANHGINKSQQAEALNNAPAVDTYRDTEEPKDTDSEIEEEKVEEEEVCLVEEKKERKKEVKVRKTGTSQLGGTDLRCKEVKKNLSQKRG